MRRHESVIRVKQACLGKPAKTQSSSGPGINSGHSRTTDNMAAQAQPAAFIANEIITTESSETAMDGTGVWGSALARAQTPMPLVEAGSPFSSQPHT
ncbi:hypothetical protein AB0F17_22275 [Nonomuraea sp. NPDC026600]|uniref:hypothetical protein n=1 Tax=Nonomuraea sp. NPDC026600 TaxID=3155363 RepID=UPI0033F1C5E3